MFRYVYPNIFQKFFVSVFFFIASYKLCFAGGYEYSNLDDFVQEHPEQVSITQSFANTVRSPSIPLAQKNSEPVKIAIVYPGFQSSDYWRRSLKAFQARLKELNVNFIAKIYLSHPSADKASQSVQLSDALSWSPDYLVYSSAAVNHNRLMQKILIEGKPKLILQNITTPYKAWHKYPPFLYTGFDHQAGTTKLSKHIFQNPPKNFALMYYGRSYISQMRGDIFAQQAEQQGLDKIGSYYTKGQRSNAFKATQEILSSNPNIEMIFASSTDIALGIIDALKKTDKLDQVIVNGWGGGDLELAAVKNRSMDLTVMRINDDASVAMAEAIKMDIQGKANQVPQIYSGDMVIIDTTTPSDKIDEYKQQAFRYSSQINQTQPEEKP